MNSQNSLSRYVKIYLCFTIILFFSPGAIFSQSLTLTKKQMHEDLDTLISTIARISPHIAIKKDVWKYDALREMNVLGKEIDTISSDLSYYLLLQKALTLSQDMHTSSWFPLSPWAQAQDEAYRRQRSLFKMAIPNTYMDGKYIVREAFTYGKDTIGIGAEITHFEGKPVDRYVRGHLSGRYYAYDIKHGKFFGAGFFKNPETIFRDSLTFTFRLPSGNSRTLTMPTREFTRYLPVAYKRKHGTGITFWEEEKVLYIRLTEMNSDSIPFLQRELGRYRSRVPEIKRIIIDFRGNPGGDDITWQSLYAAIIPERINYQLKISATKSVGKEKESSPLLAKYRLYTLVDKTESLMPSDSSLRFTGPVYVLFEDHYSSAGSAMIVPNARPDDHFYTIGRRTGNFLGVGYAPLLFKLPHTSLPYRVAPSIEVTGAKKPADLMHDNLEIEVPYDIRDFISTSQYSGALNDKAYLLQYDPFIRTVMRL
ncbi:S41 family peptidase [Chitinophaga barathri]|uniref:Tail specific protease domain-containing protein n=1 Tax=Chitinophaga barathri TaxID=1647451 RepID=A0A3N4MR49_9BACT|nr:S41 family peptidase [Chitinophaga barathri]RPD42600.1 hypothetical protein EG028_05365 [Chitinophaga barathri]